MKKTQQLLMLFKTFEMCLIGNQIKYGQTKSVKFTIDQ